MIPILILRSGILTYNTVLQSVDSAWQHAKVSLAERYVPQGLLFTVERGGFGMLKEELLRNKPRENGDPYNSCSSTGMLITADEKIKIVSWKNINEVGYRLMITDYHEHGGLAITVSGDGDEIASVIMNERPDYTNEQLGDLVSELLGEGVGATVTYLPHETKSVKELAKWHRDHTAQLSEVKK